jgi:hypothetical protein
MSSQFGYIYIRLNEWYLNKNICKLGTTENIPYKHRQYISCEPNRGRFVYVYEIDLYEMDIIDELLKKHFDNFNYRHNNNNDGGSEFFYKDIIQLIPFVLDAQNIKYRILSKEEIYNLSYKDLSYKDFRKSVKNTNKPKENKKDNKNDIKHNFDPLILRSVEQDTIVKNVAKFYESNDKGILVVNRDINKTNRSISLSLIKSRLSFWISQELKNTKKIIIGVPSAKLLDQWVEGIISVYPNKQILSVNKDVKFEHIEDFLKINNNLNLPNDNDNNELIIVITTYASSHKIRTICDNIKFTFDIGINDDVYHLSNNYYNKQEKTKIYSNILYIPVIKRLSLTKTLKLIDYNKDEKNISNVNYEFFGDVINTNSNINDKIIFEQSPTIKTPIKMIIRPIEQEIKTPPKLIIRPIEQEIKTPPKLIIKPNNQLQNLYIQEPSF